MFKDVCCFRTSVLIDLCQTRVKRNNRFLKISPTVSNITKSRASLAAPGPPDDGAGLALLQQVKSGGAWGGWTFSTVMANVVRVKGSDMFLNQSLLATGNLCFQELYSCTIIFCFRLHLEVL